MSDDEPSLWSRSVGDTGADFVLLHPGGSDSRALQLLVDQLASDYRLHLPEQRGHGHTPDVEGPLTFEALADETVRFIETLHEGTHQDPAAPVHLFGYSDGAIVALHVALRRPDLVRSLVFAAGVFHRNGWLPGVLDGAALDFLRDAYGEVSPDGVEHWPVIEAKLTALHERKPELTVDDLASLTVPTLLVVGDDDEVRLEHILAMYTALPNAELAVVPRASHGVVVEKPGLVASLIRDLHRPERSAGYAPIRRAGAAPGPATEPA